MRRALVLGSLFLGTACGDSGTSSNPDMTMTSNPDTAMAQTVTVSGKVLDYRTTPAMPMPIQGVQVCVYPDTASCVMTDAAGDYKNLLAAQNAQVGISFTKNGFLDSIAEITTTKMAASENYLLIDSGTATGLAALLGAQIDEAKSLLATTAVDTMGNYLKGVSFGSMPATGMNTGPYYFVMPAAGMFLPDKNATATSENGAAIFLNVPAGDYTVTATAMNKVCVPVPTQAWVGTQPNQAKVKAIAKKFVSFAFVCM
jgi:hypothetical protein